MSLITGYVQIVPGVISTDDILPARYKHMYTDPEELARYVFSIHTPGMAERLRPGTIIVCDGIFGIGSSREQAVSSLMGAGVVAFISPRFGRIFFRNSWNLGAPAIEATEADVARLINNEEIKIDLRAGRTTTPDFDFEFLPPPDRLIDMVENGGLLEHIAKSLQAQGAVTLSEKV